MAIDMERGQLNAAPPRRRRRRRRRGRQRQRVCGMKCVRRMNRISRRHREDWVYVKRISCAALVTGNVYDDVVQFLNLGSGNLGLNINASRCIKHQGWRTAGLLFIYSTLIKVSLECVTKVMRQKCLISCERPTDILRMRS